MYGICAHRSDGKVLNCANATKAVKVKIQALVAVQFEYNIAGETLSCYFPASFYYRKHNSPPLLIFTPSLYYCTSVVYLFIKCCYCLSSQILCFPRGSRVCAPLSLVMSVVQLISLTHYTNKSNR